VAILPARAGPTIGVSHATLLQFAQVNDAAAATTKKLQKYAILAEYFRSLSDEDLRSRVRTVNIYARAKPTHKLRLVEAFKANAEIIAMTGDGVNDAPALAQADLGLAIGTGTDVAIEASDLTLVSGDLRAAADAIRLARRTLRTIKGNLFWAFAYNVAAIPLAVAGLLSPVVAAAAMAFSSVFVVTNSLRLRRFKSFREE